MFLLQEEHSNVVYAVLVSTDQTQAFTLKCFTSEFSRIYQKNPTALYIQNFIRGMC